MELWGPHSPWNIKPYFLPPGKNQAQKSCLSEEDNDPAWDTLGSYYQEWLGTKLRADVRRVWDSVHLLNLDSFLFSRD